MLFQGQVTTAIRPAFQSFAAMLEAARSRRNRFTCMARKSSAHAIPCFARWPLVVCLVFYCQKSYPAKISRLFSAI